MPQLSKLVALALQTARIRIRGYESISILNLQLLAPAPPSRFFFLIIHSKPQSARNGLHPRPPAALRSWKTELILKLVSASFAWSLPHHLTSFFFALHCLRIRLGTESVTSNPIRTCSANPCTSVHLETRTSRSWPNL